MEKLSYRLDKSDKQEMVTKLVSDWFTITDVEQAYLTILYHIFLTTLLLINWPQVSKDFIPARISYSLPKLVDRINVQLQNCYVIL